MQLNGATLNGVELNGAVRRVSRSAEVIELADSVRWRLRVLLDGVDISARLTDTVSVDREEGAARVGKLTLLPALGSLDLDTLTGKPLHIYRQRLEGDEVGSEQLRFVGETLRPGLDAFSKKISLTASCGLQNRIEQKSIEEIIALLPGSYWAEAVFGELEAHWQYCQDRCSTVPGNLDCAPDGSIRFTSWAAKSVPHFSFGPSEVIDGSLAIEPADAGQLLNQVEITLEYRYTRLRHRPYTVRWTHPTDTFCGWLAEGSTELPTVSMLLEAVEQGGWALVGTPQTVMLPPSMPNPCGLGGAWINTFTDDPHLLSFAASLAQRTSQTLTERYKLTLEATGSISTFTVQTSRERYSDEVEFDTSSWEELPATSSPPGAVGDGSGDWIIDKDEAGRRENTLRTAMHAEHVRIIASHRQTRVAFQTPITDAVYDTSHTARIELLGLSAQGKVARVQEVWDIGQGLEVATIELAISRGGASLTADSLAIPARPVFDFGPVPDHGTVLATQLGGRSEAPVFDEELDGFSGNYGVTTPGAELYPRRLQFTTPDIEGRHRDPAEAETVATYQINIPTDLLIMEVL
ncbi:MAG: hypothetical protein Q7J46_14225 [Pseudomonas sp.]|nr:hypothetical protein [Pseudomonas sp.]